MRTAALLIDDLVGQAHTAAYRPRGPLVVRRGGCVAGRCGVARALGIAPGWTVDRALRVVPTAVVVTHKPHIIRTFEESVRAQAHALTPFLEGAAPGLLYLGVNQPKVLAELAEAVGARVGVAASRRLARLVAAATPPGTLRVVDGAADDVLARVPTPVLSRLGIAEDTIERLQLFGLRTVDEVAKLTRRHLLRQFGKEGKALHTLLAPGDEPPLTAYQPPPSVQVALDIDPPTCEPAGLDGALEEALRDGRRALGTRRAQRVQVRLTLRPPTRAGSSEPLHRSADRLLHTATAEANPFRRALRRLVHTLLKQEAPGAAADRVRGEVTRLEIELGALTEAQAAQGHLFAERPAARQAVAAVEARYPGAMLQVQPQDTGFFPESRYALVPVQSASTDARAGGPG